MTDGTIPCTVAHLGNRSLDDALLSDDERIACMARLASSTATDALTAFISAELTRGTREITLMEVLARFQIQTHAAVSANFFREGGFSAMADLYKHMIDGIYVHHATASASEIKAFREERA